MDTLDTQQINDAAPVAALHDPWSALLHYSDAVLAQGRALAAAHECPGTAGYAAFVGPHLRHVIEHYEALLLRPHAAEADYDGRPRDRAVEQSPSLARERIDALRAVLRSWRKAAPDDVLIVHTLGGVDGQWPLVTASTVARELVFLASHAVHHFALLREHCTRAGIALAPQFGIAPATVAWARQAH
jgi:hypothetical protein